MKVAIVTTEAAPFIKTGGLGDAVSSLAKELTQMEHEVLLMMPLYPGVSVMPTGLISPLRVSFAGRTVTYSIIEGLHEKIKIVFIDAPSYFYRNGIYGDSNGDFGDNDERFVFFTRACLEYFRRKEERPDIFHCNDWPTGLLPLFLRTHYYHDPLSKTPVLFTIHNLAYQGNFPGDRFGLLELGSEYFAPSTLEFYGKVSFLKSGLLYSDILTTLSKKYSQEIQTPEQGSGLEGILTTRQDRLYGVLNGNNALSGDASWRKSAEEYLSLYKKAIELKS